MINATPVIFSSSFKKFLPLLVSGNVYSCFRSEEVVTEVETLGDVLDRLEAEDRYGLDRNQLVGKVVEYAQPSNYHCGGVVYYWIGLVNKVLPYDHRGMTGVLVSLDDNGTFKTAIPA